ncbi:AsnC family transcriptional regulator [Ignicoccus islandicus DSM 13165]|uniref:AsnC family transcriptional regulator n=1 Tax=Ignicoccus islandicus DSM 13165 TaxID=940295 RepID=A0A0U3E298_9CREN|nr:Lrp/AsnC ligand binding domain-containing protein [Ignicoccus islandicus]ALU12043.1 AsnC family transcriptional regulator [Ignicoccus islandicus DSM 13165]
MAIAIVLINTDIGKEVDVFERLKQIPEVKEVYITYGTFDIVAKLEAPTLAKLNEAITRNIRNMPGVRSTLTLIGVEGKHFQR